MVRAKSLPFESLFLTVYLEAHTFVLFFSPRGDMEPHVKEGVKSMIFILNLDPISLIF